MFDKFTDRSRKVMGFAREEAQRLNHDFIGTEHVLLALIREGSGVAASVLKSIGADLGKVQAEVGRLVSPGTAMVTMGQIPFTPRTKAVLERSLDEASGLGHAYIGTEHLLLGLIGEDEGHASQVLRNLDVKADDVRAGVLELLGEGGPDDGKDTQKEWRAVVGSMKWIVGPLTNKQRIRDLGVAKRDAIDAIRRILLVTCELRSGHAAVSRQVARADNAIKAIQSLTAECGRVMSTPISEREDESA